MFKDEEDTSVLSQSLQSFAQSWNRAATFPESTLVADDQYSRTGSVASYQRPSSLPQPTSRRASTVTEHKIPHHVIAQDAVSVDEHTALLKELSQSTHKLYADRSSLVQTVFNTVNLVFGVGLLSFPLALKNAGFLFGLALFTWSAITTLWTARMIEKCLSHDSSIVSFGGLAHAAYGRWARFIVTALVACELTAASIGQIILFADGAQTLVPGSNETIWKVLCGVAFIILSCAPLRYLGTSSALSVLCFFIIAGVMIAVGLTSPSTPGSLRSPAEVSFLPKIWTTVPSSIGMVLATWGGHTVFPELYHDMKRPDTFFKSVKTTYAISFPTYLLIGVLGYLMFGNQMQGPITSEIMSLKHIPSIFPPLIMAMVTFIPIAKVPLNIIPLCSALERAYDQHVATEFPTERVSLGKSILNATIRPAIRVIIGSCFVLFAILFPQLDKVMSVLGVVAGLLVAIILPICFYLTIMKEQVSTMERYLCGFTIMFSVILAVASLTSVFT